MGNQTADYKLLPLRFTRLDEARYVLTNLVGDYMLVSRETLSEVLNGTLAKETEPYPDLVARQFIYEDNCAQAVSGLASRYRQKSALLAEFTSLFIFVVTLRCDHSCPYCQVSRQTQDKAAYDMDEETALRGLDFVFQSPSSQIKIEFQGGEPLLNFKLIKMIVAEAQNRNHAVNKNLRFVIATNLALIDDDILDYCLENDIHISTSLDGPEDIHKANRPRPGINSYVKVTEGIKKVREALGANKISALMTTTEASLCRVEEIVDEYVNQGFQSIFLRPLSPYGFAIKTKWYERYNASDWLEFYFKGLEYIISLNKKGKFFVEKYAQIILKKLVSQTDSGYVDLQSPAGLGISVLVFNYDGYVYASDESRMLAEMGDKKFCLGKIHSATYEQVLLSNDLVDTLAQSITISAPMCSECAFEPFCGSDPAYHYATQKDVVGNKARSGFCQRNMAIIRYLIAKLEDDEDTKKVLLSWIERDDISDRQLATYPALTGNTCS